MRFRLPVYMSGTVPLFSLRQQLNLREALRQQRAAEERTLAENADVQWHALIRLLHHAYNTSPFYRRRFDEAGLRPESLRGPDDFAKLPPLTRADIRENLTQMLSTAFRQEDLLESFSGGTTDTPVCFRRDRDCLAKKAAAHLAFNRWAGFLSGEKVLMLWGAQSDFAANPSWRWKLHDRYLMRRAWCGVGVANEETFEGMRRELDTFKPHAIYAYPSPLYLFCKYLLACGDNYHRPKTAICTAEAIQPHWRPVIREALGCEPFELYGSREFGMIGGECEQHNGLHLNTNAAYVDFSPIDSADGGLNEVFVTDLLNYGMPLIRYKINDCVSVPAQRCACGRGYPLLGRITGRTTDLFHLPNGDVVPGVAMTGRLVQTCPGLEKVQVIQETLNGFHLRYVPGPRFTCSDLEYLSKQCRMFLGNEVHLRFSPVHDIERERSGKTRFCISNVCLEATHVSCSDALGRGAE